MNKQQLLEMMEEAGMHAGKILGQNFLLDGNLLDFIVRSGMPEKDEVILEVGPGFGALTRGLLECGAQVYAVEFDHRICEFLRKNMAHYDNFHLTEGDACRVDFLEVLPKNYSDFKTIANLPYAISSIFIARLLELENPPQTMLFMLQKEMAQRLAASTETKNYGSLSVRIQLMYDVKILRIVPPQVFFPQPGVESALLICQRKESYPPRKIRERIDGISKCVFAQRRKQLQKTLSINFPSELVMNVLAELGIAPETRPEKLTAAQFVELAEKLFNEK